LIDFVDLFFAEPFDTFTIFPQAIFYFLVLGNNIFSETMLFTAIPVAFVSSSISPNVLTKSVLFVILVLALIFTAILPKVDAHAFHVVLEPLTFISAAV
jgi:hypothetical protein